MITTEYVLSLYRRYSTDLQSVRVQQRRFLRRNNNAVLRRLHRMNLRRHLLRPMLDDLEAEITYLFIRDRKPQTVIEMSPNTGWSTTWILSALRDNQQGGQLWSYDIHDTSTKLVPPQLADGRWHFVLGDARETIRSAPDFDYLFIDSDHSAPFAKWYVDALFPRVRPGLIVSVHDVFHQAELSEEGRVVADWLTKRGVAYWTIASAVAPKDTADFIRERHKLGEHYVPPVHASQANPMMFFEM